MHFITAAVFVLPAALAASTSPTDPSASMCFGYLAAAYIFSDTCMHNTTCLCGVGNFLETVVNCVEGTSVLLMNDTAVHRKASYASIAKFCHLNSTTNLESYFANSSNLNAYKGNTSDHKIGTWVASDAFKPSELDLERAYKGYYSYSRAEPLSRRYGGGILAYWAGVLLIHSVLNFWNKLWPLSYQHALNTGAGRYWRKNFVMPAFSKYLPRNVYSIEIFFFVALSLIFSFVNFPFTRNNYIYRFKQSYAYGSYCGVRTGYLALYLLPLMLLFAGRNNFLQYLTGLTQDSFVAYHRWAGRVVVLLLFIHAIAYTISRLNAGVYSAFWHQTYFKWGIVGFSFGCFMVVQAARLLRQRAYETFLVIHIIAAVLFLVGGYYHLKTHEEDLALKFMYASFAVWAFDRAARLVRLLASSFGQKATITADCGMLIVTMPIPRWWRLHSNPGLYTFIHFLHPHVFHQSHPFTISLNTKNSCDLKLVCRVKDGVTKTINSWATECEDATMTCRVCLDGPYGYSVDFSNFDEIVFIAGGVGITAPFAYIQHLVLSDQKKSLRIRLLWAVRDVSVESWYEPELDFLRSCFNVEVMLYTGGETEKLQVLDIPSAVRSLIEDTTGSMGFLCCGPDGMAAETRGSVAANLERTEHYVEYFEESFSW